MARKACLIGTALILAAAHPGDAAQRGNAGTVIAQIDQSFVCPEFLPDAAARRSELMAFSAALRSIGPKRITYRQASLIRSSLLRRHNCSATSVAATSPTPIAVVTSAAR